MARQRHSGVAFDAPALGAVERRPRLASLLAEAQGGGVGGGSDGGDDGPACCHRAELAQRATADAVSDTARAVAIAGEKKKAGPTGLEQVVEAAERGDH